MSHFIQIQTTMKNEDLLPRRIVCLTEETTEMLYLLGASDRIAGISGYTVRPPRAREEKPMVSAFTTANIRKILELKPDLVLCFSDLQADIAQQLIRQGVEVHVFNQRSIEEIYRMIRQLGCMVGKEAEALAWIDSNRAMLDQMAHRANALPLHPKVYFEEWYDPLISGIRWVSELIDIAGGRDIFPELAAQPLAKDRIIRDPDEVVRRNPDIILVSWCGRKFKRDKIVQRPGWAHIAAVQNDHIYEIDSSIILQPGPAALTDGVHQLHQIISAWVHSLS